MDKISISYEETKIKSFDDFLKSTNTTVRDLNKKGLTNSNLTFFRNSNRTYFTIFDC